MYWIIAAVVVIALVALAWWASGHNRTPAGAGLSENDRRSAPGVAEHQVRQNRSPGPVG